MNNTSVVGLFWSAVAFLCAQSVCLGRDAKSFPTRERFESAVDQIVTNRLEKAHIAGAVVVIVRDGKVLLNKGYGFANLESKRAVDPDKSLFRIASVSKVFTATAAMKLIDAGKIDPDQDVRPVLRRAGLNVDEPSFNRAITIRALLSHSAGIRDNFIPFATLATNLQGRLPFRDYLLRCAPLRWQEPGLSMVYSDTGITLAGYVMELESRKSFHELVGSAVLQPLKMKSTCYIPKPNQFANLALPYKHESNGYVRTDFLYTSIDPAIGVLTTGSDVAKFLRAHLAGDFLGPRGRELMYEAQFCEDERLSHQAACGLFVNAGKMYRELHQWGWALGYQSSLVLVPSQRLGFFVAQNGNGQLALRMDEVQTLLFGPDSNPASPIRATRRRDPGLKPCNLETLAGLYVDNRQMSRRNDVEKCETLQVTHVPEEEALDITYNRDPKQKIRWKQIGPALFGSPSTDQIISFRHAPDGQTTLLSGYSGDGAHRKVLPK